MPEPELPSGRVARLRHQIRSGGVRRIGQAVLLFFASLAVGRACEVAFSPETLSAALRAQSRAIKTIRSLTPLRLASGYLNDLSPASRGDLIYHAPAAVDSTLLRQHRDEAERRSACRLAFSFASPGTIPAPCAALGVTDRFQFLVSEQQSPRADDAPPPAAAAPVAQKSWRVPGVLVPLAALLRTATRVMADGAFASLLALFQLTAGLLGVLVVTQARSRTDTAGFDGAVSNLILLPVTAIAVGSGLAWVTQALMLGALQAFQWATGLAAAAAGASGLAGFCWYCLAKLSEKSVEGVVTGKA